MNRQLHPISPGTVIEIENTTPVAYRVKIVTSQGSEIDIPVHPGMQVLVRAGADNLKLVLDDYAGPVPFSVVQGGQ